MFSLLLSSVVAVFLAELIGDKTLYSLGALASRYSSRVIMAGLIPACFGKMLAAVLLGQSLARLPGWLTALVSAITFFLAALLLLFGVKNEREFVPVGPLRGGHGAWAAFGTIFFTEWGDPGQLAAASLVARYDAPFIIWLGASVAILAKAILGITLGAGVRYYVPEHKLRYVCAVIFAMLGIVSSFGIWK